MVAGAASAANATFLPRSALELFLFDFLWRVKQLIMNTRKNRKFFQEVLVLFKVHNNMVSTGHL
jgi:hypothetical protein